MGVLARENLENGSLLYAILYAIYVFCISKYQGKPFWKWENSNYRNENTGGIKWPNVWGAFLYTIINCVAGFAVVF